MTSLWFTEYNLTRLSQQTPRINPMSDQCWANVVDGGPTLVRHWVDVSCFLGIASPSTFTGCQNYQIRYQLMCQLLSSPICGLSDARCVSYSMSIRYNPLIPGGYLTLSVRGPTLDVRICRLQTSDSDV